MATLISPPPQGNDADLAARHAQTVICLSKLPPFHPAALKLLNIASESDTAIDDFEKVFRTDPALTADLLLVANSPLFGTRARIASIRHALTRLGIDRVRSLATTIAVSFFVRNQPRTGLVRHIWAHSIATASIAEILGKLYQCSDLYTVGLVHDLGRLGLLLTIGQPYEKCMANQMPSLDESIHVERANFGMNHCEAASHVAAKWGFPAILEKAMIRHHDAEIGPPEAPLPLVQLACRIATAVGFPEVFQDPTEMPELPAKAGACEDLKGERLRQYIEKQIETMGR